MGKTMAGKAPTSQTTTPKEGQHRTSTRYPGICCRWSEKENAWLWGFRILVADGGRNKRMHVHEFQTQEQSRDAVAAMRQRAKQERYGLKPMIERPLLARLCQLRLPTISDRAECSRSARVLAAWLELLPAGHPH